MPNSGAIDHHRTEQAATDVREHLATRYLAEAHWSAGNQFWSTAHTWVRAAAMALDVELTRDVAKHITRQLPDGRPLASVDETTYAEHTIAALRRLP